jgi:hypothetical protein
MVGGSHHEEPTSHTGVEWGMLLGDGKDKGDALGKDGMDSE